MSADAERWPPPNEPAAFESLCLDLWKDVWGDPGAQKNGRSGQAQAGVDVFGVFQGQPMGVQCKQKDGLLRSSVKVKELEREVELARGFKPPLHTFILAHSGSTDARVQERARELSGELQAKGLFKVEVWSWAEIWHEIHGREDLLKRILPIYWPRTTAVGAGSAAKSSSGPLAIWQEKLEFLQTEEGTAVDPAQKFRLKKLIAEAQDKIREYGG